MSGGGGTQLVPTVDLQTTENDSIATARMASPSGVGVTLDLTLASRAFSNNPSQRVGCVYTGSAIVDPA